MEKQIEDLLSNREKFDDFEYTKLETALSELKKRQNNKKLKDYVNKSLPAGVPKILKNHKCAVEFVQIATPNLELRRFISIVDAIDEFVPLFFEFTEDKFTDNNDWKRNLGKLTFFFGRGKKGGEKLESLRVIDFNKFKGKKLSEVRTLWGESLSDFHHELFRYAYQGDRSRNIIFYDGSKWFAKSGGRPQQYYEHFFRLFLANGILFENYMLDEKEEWFTKNIVLPALLKVRKEIGMKPLIVNVQPTEIEGRPFWTYHPQESIAFVKKKLNLVV